MGTALEIHGKLYYEIEGKMCEGSIKVNGMLNSVLSSKNIVNKIKTLIFKSSVQGVIYCTEIWRSGEFKEINYCLQRWSFGGGQQGN